MIWEKYFLDVVLLVVAWYLLKNYYNGITPEICTKLLYYIRLALREKESNDNELLTLANQIQNWSEKNYGSTLHEIESPNPYYFWNNSNLNSGF